MSDEYQWRQLGSVVNAVLMQVKTQAVRNGSISKLAAPAFAEPETRSTRAPIQLELPLGDEPPARAAPKFGAPRSPRGLRLM